MNKWTKEYEKQYKKGWYIRNKRKLIDKQKLYYINNKSKILKYQKEYRKNNKQTIKLYKYNYSKSNRKSINNYKKLYNKNKYNKDFRFKVLNNLRGRIINALKNNYKSLSTMFLVGCEIDYLMYYLQSIFKKGMNWDNYGKWHIDHIEPCSKFNLSKKSEQLKCFHYSNLQPLWAKENLKKANL